MPIVCDLSHELQVPTTDRASDAVVAALDHLGVKKVSMHDVCCCHSKQGSGMKQKPPNLQCWFLF